MSRHCLIIIFHDSHPVARPLSASKMKISYTFCQKHGRLSSTRYPLCYSLALWFTVIVLSVQISCALKYRHFTNLAANTNSKDWAKIQSNRFDTCCYKMLQLAAEVTNKQFQSVFISWQCSSMSLFNLLQFHQQTTICRTQCLQRQMASHDKTSKINIKGSITLKQIVTWHH